MDDDSQAIPRVEFSGVNYEVGGSKALVSTIIGHLRMAFFALLFVGDVFFQPFGGIHQMPSIVQDANQYIKENKMQFGIFVFFIGSMVQTQLMQSGAFEIYVNGNLEFSKLQHG